MIYFDNAATSFIKPKNVIAETVNAIQKYGNPGRGGYSLSLNASQKIFNTRLSLANFFHSMSPERVVFTMNATMSLNIAIKCFSKNNSHIIISCFEHNSVFRPVNLLAKTSCEYDIADISLENDAETVCNIINLIRENTHMIVLTHVSNVCGKVLPISDIIKKVKEKNPNIIVVVDAAQSAGVLDISIVRDKIDILCIPAHKNMFGICGLGAIIFNDNLDITQAKTLIEGGAGINSLDELMPEDLPEHFEAGTPNTPAIAALCAGVEYINSETLEKIYAHEKKLYDKAIEILKEFKNISLYSDFTHNGYIGPILFNVTPYKCEEVSRKLAKHEIFTRDGFHCSPLAHKKLGTVGGGVRISLNYHNKSSELDKFYRAIKTL